MRIKTTTYSDVQQKPCQFYWHGLLHVTIVSDGVAAQKEALRDALWWLACIEQQYALNPVSRSAHSAPAGALAQVLLSSCLVKNLLSHHWSHFYQQLDSLFLQLEFFCLLRRNLAVPLIFMGQDSARPAIASDFFQKSLAQGLDSLFLQLEFFCLLRRNLAV